MNGCKAYALLISFLLFSLSLSAQQTVTIKGQILGRTVEKDSPIPLPSASIALLDAKDSVFIKGTVSDEKGFFSIQLPSLKNKSYLLKASFMGFGPVFRLLENPVKQTAIDPIILKEDEISLKEVLVTALQKPVVQKGDTTIINTSVYKTPEGAYLIELLKRIPGVEYNPTDQSLTYNGKPINGIRINGENFFSGDKKMALENLPAELISAIKIYDKKSELEKMTKVSSGEKNYVLDMQTKKQFNGTLLSSAKLGYGDNRKKDYELIGNYFENGGDNFSLIGRSSNMYMTSNYRGNIQNLAGINFVKKFKEELMVTGNMSFNGNKMGNQQRSYNEQYLTESNQYTLFGGESLNDTNGVNGMATLMWKPDKRTLLNVFATFGRTTSHASSSNRQYSFNDNPHLDITTPLDLAENTPDSIKINAGNMQSRSYSRVLNYNLSVDATRQLNEKGSNISVRLQYSGNRSKNNGFTLSSTTYYQIANSMGNDSVLYRNQYQKSPSDNEQYSLGFSFTQPVNKSTRLQLSYTLSKSNQQNDRNTYDLSGFTGNVPTETGFLPPDYETGYLDSLSNKSHNDIRGHEVALFLSHSTEKWEVESGASAGFEQRSTQQKTGLLRADTTAHNINWRPFVQIAWQNKKSRISLRYNGDTRQPSLTDLLSLTDNSNPLNIVRGNPSLKPSYNHFMHLEAQNTDKGFLASIDCQQEFNSQTRIIMYNKQTGGRETYPVNVNGNWSTSAVLRYQKRIKLFNISAMSRARYARSVGYINEGASAAPERSTTYSKGFDQNIRLSYFPEWGGFDLVSNSRFQRTENLLRDVRIYTRDYSFGLNAYASLPANLQLKSDLTYSFRTGTNIRSGQDDQLLWNLGLTSRFLKKKQCELSFYWADILSRKKSYSRTTTANGFYENHTQQIGSFFIISLKYRFNKNVH